MSTRSFALAVGMLYLIVGLLGFFPGLLSPPPIDAPRMAVDTGYGYVLGVFPVNVLHNLVYLVIGAWALMAYRSLSGSIAFSQRLILISGLLMVMGLFPFLDTALGLIPLFGPNVWMHGVTALLAAYFGYYVAARAVPVEQIVPKAA
jgi:hypothetical protein